MAVLVLHTTATPARRVPRLMTYIDRIADVVSHWCVHPQFSACSHLTSGRAYYNSDIQPPLRMTPLPVRFYSGAPYAQLMQLQTPVWIRAGAGDGSADASRWGGTF